MPFNGSGTYVLPAGNPVVTGTTISSTTQNNTMSDVATALSTTITKDGQTTPTANIPMGGFKLTGLGAATANGDAVRYQDVGSFEQNQTFTAFTTGGSSTAYTLTPIPAITAYTAGQSFDVTFHTTSGAAPTLQISGIATPPTLVRRLADGTVTNILAGDIPAGTYRVRTLSATQVEVIGLWITSAINSTPLLHLNDIINGDFNIAQAGTSFAVPASGAYDLDGWLNTKVGAAVFTVAQVAGSVSGRMSRQVTITTADAAVAAGDFVTDTTRIEGYNILKYVGNTFTVAGRAKVPVTGIHCIYLKNSGSDRTYVAEVNFTSANTWTDFSFTVTGGLPTAGTWNYTTGIGLEVGFTHMAGTTFQTTANAWNTGNFLGTANQVNDCATNSNVWALEKMTLNLGTVAAVSEIDVGDELHRCQRYFEIGFMRCDAYNTAGALISTMITYKSTKRATPTVTGVGVGFSNASTFAVDAASGTSGFEGTATVTVTGTAAFAGSYTSAARL